MSELELSLAACEAVIEKGLSTFVDVGRALLTIRDARLYRETYTTFEEYLDKRWHQMSRPRAYQMIEAATVMGALSTMVDKPDNERQARELAPLMREGEAPMAEVWRDLREQFGDKVTAAKIKDAVQKRLKQEIARERIPEPAVTPTMPTGKYSCIVIDPPWPIEKIEREERPNQGQTLDYPVMSLDQIGDLPIGELADPNGCHVYLWVTQRFLPDGLRLFETWGVRYQCVMTWVKNVGFTPFSWMYSTEHVLFGRIGSLNLLRMGLRLDFNAPTTGHSRKPNVFYERVRQASPEPRLDMFARETHEGFLPWGNEVAV